MPSILENTNAIQEYLNGDSLNVIADRYGVSRPAVKNYLTKHKIPMRKTTYVKKSKYEFNEHWLDEIDCQEKAYFLGFFAADGNIDLTNSNYRVRIKLKREDKYILERFNDLLESNREVKDIDSPNRFHKNGIESTSTIYWSSKYFCERMIELGITPQKTITLKFPQYLINSKFLSSFVRGVMDGDGNINIITSKGGTKRATITIAGSNYFIPELQKILKDMKITSFIKKGNTDNYCLLDIDRQEDIKPFLDWIYKDSTIHLTRKYERYIEFLNGRDFTKEDEGAKRRKIKAMEPDIIKDYESGMTKKEIQEKYKISGPTFYKIMERNNITLMSKR